MAKGKASPREPDMSFANYTPPNRLIEVERDVATAIAKVAYFISPKVVQRIAQLNTEWQQDFQNQFQEKIRPEHYFYQNSACVFPGVRRQASKEERKLRRQKYHVTAAAIIDDNWFPRELWCFLCTGKRYSGPLWKSSGLGNFELAHVLPHKGYELSGVSSWFAQIPENEPVHGLFCCAANVILLPKGMARPTDGTAGIRAAVLKRYFDLYGSIHAVGFNGFVLPSNLTWFDSIQWNPPIEPKDWAERVERLDKFRRARIAELLLGSTP